MLSINDVYHQAFPPKTLLVPLGVIVVCSNYYVGCFRSLGRLTDVKYLQLFADI